MSGQLEVIGWALFTLSLIGVLYTRAAGWSVSWFLGRPDRLATTFPPVTILKPLHGDEPGLRQALEGFLTQDYPGPVQIVFGVRDSGDAALRVVRALIHDYPDRDINVVVDPRVWGANLKISNLINMQEAIRHRLIVLADSDVSVSPLYLHYLVGALSDPAVGFATCAYIGVATGNLWSRLSAMAINHHFLPSIALGVRIGLAKPCFGPTVAFQRDVFEQAGGFARFKDHLADDFEIGRAIRALGYGFAIPSMLIGHGCPERAWRSVVSHELRWARTIRLIDPVSYAGSVICHPLPFAFAALVLLHGSPDAWALVALALASRLFVVAEVARTGGGDAGVWWMSPLRDLLSAGVHVAGFMTRTVEWRGRRFTVRAGGVLTPHRSLPAQSPPGPVASLAAIVATPAPAPADSPSVL